MHKLPLIFALLVTIPAFAEVPVSLCAQPIKSKAATSPAARHEVLVQCGTNTLNQNFTSPATSIPGASQPAFNAKEENLLRPAIDSVPVPWIAAIAVLLGALAAALATILVANLNARSQRKIETDKLRANVVATERLRWLQDIRARLAAAYRTMDIQYDLLKRPVPPGGMVTIQTEFDSQSREIVEEVNMITLMLNPAKNDQSNLRDSLQQALAHLAQSFHLKSTGGSQFNDAHYQRLKQMAFDSMTAIGVATWKQVKNLS